MHIDLTQDSQLKFKGHLVPCKIGYTGETKELKNFDENHCIRGRVVQGQKVADTAVLMQGEKPVARGTLYNYEREGNQDRLCTEMDKWHDFLTLNDAIHQ
ncbi:(Zrou_YGOB_RNH203) [Zygosaccharomyces parabailii]|nr:(Zrou_YGOB_RNH203) [Zygosaccharomyces parabailii]